MSRAEANLSPSETAERATLIRRLSLDLRDLRDLRGLRGLRGLPPSPDEVDAFVYDRSLNRYRMPSWMIRDQALTAAGLLVPELGGAPVKPCQPPGVWADVSFGNKRYEQDQGAAQNNRSRVPPSHHGQKFRHR